MLLSPGPITGILTACLNASMPGSPKHPTITASNSFSDELTSRIVGGTQRNSSYGDSIDSGPSLTALTSTLNPLNAIEFSTFLLLFSPSSSSPTPGTAYSTFRSISLPHLFQHSQRIASYHLSYFVIRITVLYQPPDYIPVFRRVLQTIYKRYFFKLCTCMGLLYTQLPCKEVMESYMVSEKCVRAEANVIYTYQLLYILEVLHNAFYAMLFMLLSECGMGGSLYSYDSFLICKSLKNLIGFHS